MLGVAVIPGAQLVDPRCRLLPGGRIPFLAKVVGGVAQLAGGGRQLGGVLANLLGGGEQRIGTGAGVDELRDGPAAGRWGTNRGRQTPGGDNDGMAGTGMGGAAAAGVSPPPARAALLSCSCCW